MSLYKQKLLEWLCRQVQDTHGTFRLGICGAQGSGKSTLAHQLQSLLADYNLNCAVLSLDDLYLSKARRRQLAQSVHPLLATRGVPGTHDVTQGLKLFEAIDQLSPGKSLRLPRFDKASDDTAAIALWPELTTRPDVLIFEGWCVGVPAQAQHELLKPINPLEQQQDQDGRWRHWVNQQLAQDYQKLFSRLHKLMFLQIPHWDAVLRWRQQQEQQTAASARRDSSGLMSPQGIAQFIQFYERISRHALNVLPASADVLRRLGPEHQLIDQVIREHPA